MASSHNLSPPTSDNQSAPVSTATPSSEPESPTLAQKIIAFTKRFKGKMISHRFQKWMQDTVDLARARGELGPSSANAPATSAEPPVDPASLYYSHITGTYSTEPFPYPTPAATLEAYAAGSTTAPKPKRGKAAPAPNPKRGKAAPSPPNPEAVASRPRGSARRGQASGDVTQSATSTKEKTAKKGKAVATLPVNPDTVAFRTRGSARLAEISRSDTNPMVANATKSGTETTNANKEKAAKPERVPAKKANVNQTTAAAHQPPTRQKAAAAQVPQVLVPLTSHINGEKRKRDASDEVSTNEHTAKKNKAAPLAVIPDTAAPHTRASSSQREAGKNGTHVTVTQSGTQTASANKKNAINNEPKAPRIKIIRDGKTASVDYTTSLSNQGSSKIKVIVGKVSQASASLLTQVSGEKRKRDTAEEATSQATNPKKVKLRQETDTPASKKQPARRSTRLAVPPRRKTLNDRFGSYNNENAQFASAKRKQADTEETAAPQASHSNTTSEESPRKVLRIVIKSRKHIEEELAKTGKTIAQVAVGAAAGAAAQEARVARLV